MGVCRAIDEVIGKIGTIFRRLLDVVDGQVQLLERKAAHLADHAGDQLVGGLRQWMALRPRRAITVSAPLYAEEAVGVQPERSSAEMPQRVQGVANHQTHTGE